MTYCPKCQKAMDHIAAESTPLRNVYRCFNCKIRDSKRSGLAWTLTGARVVLFLSTGIPDFTDALDFFP
jgi:hypothetical protein